MIGIATNIIKGLLRPQPKGAPSDLGWWQEKRLKHQEDSRLKTASIGKWTVHYRRPYEVIHTWRELFDRSLYRFEAGTERPLIFDCGANIGIGMLYFKNLYPEATVHCFEPDSENFSILQKNVTANGLKDVHLHEAAVWTEQGTLRFEARGSEASRIGEGNITVQSLRLRDLLEGADTVHFLKIDIEGAEYPVLEDIRPLLPRVQHLFLEYHGKAGETHRLSDLLRWVQEAGFSVYVRTAADALSAPFMEKTTGTMYDVQLNLFCYR